MGDKIVCPTCLSAYDVTNGIVDNGPSMRNITSFNVTVRDETVKATLPERIPAFAKRKFLGRSNVDPRRFLVLGDSEAAISAMDALRMGFTGEIVNIPCSDNGKYENIDIFRRQFSPLTRN